MKILHVSYIYPPELKVADGITNVVYNVSKELANRGHQVVVYTSNLSDLHGYRLLPPGHHLINGVGVFYFRSLWKYKTFIFTPSILRHIIRNAEDFDVIHVHDARSFQGISAYMLNCIKNVPYVFQPHGSYLASLPEPYKIKILKNALDNLVSKRIFKKASKIIALSGFEAEQYRCMGVPKEKIAIIPNGIDLAEYANLPAKGCFKRKFGIPEEKKIILYLGRIHKTKGIDILIKAYALLTKKMGTKNTVLVIAGPDDGYLKEVKFLADSLSVSSLTLFTGPLYGRDKLEAYVDSDLYVLPSRYETFPMSLLEAYACRKPVIASEVGGLRDLVVNGETGLLFENGNIEELAESIHCLLDDCFKAEELGLNGRKFVEEKFPIEKIVDKLEVVYEKSNMDKGATKNRVSRDVVKSKVLIR